MFLAFTALALGRLDDGAFALKRSVRTWALTNIAGPLLPNSRRAELGKDESSGAVRYPLDPSRPTGEFLLRSAYGSISVLAKSVKQELRFSLRRPLSPCLFHLFYTPKYILRRTGPASTNSHHTRAQRALARP